MSESLPSRARVVVIGGGVIGTSVAYHLAHLGWTDVVLLERDRLTSGTTWHAAGLMVTFGSTSETSTEMRKYTRDLYSRLEAETGQSTGFKPVGFIELATDAGPARGVPPGRGVQPLLRRRRARDLGRRGRASCSRSPAPTTCSPASTSPRTGGRTPSTSRWRWRRARGMQGVTIVEGVPVTGVARAARRASPACAPTHGDIEAEYVVNCAGMWARQLGEPAGVNDPAAGRRALLPHHRGRSTGIDAELAGDRGPAPTTATSARRSAA